MADDLIARCRKLLEQSDGPPVAIAQLDLAALIALAEPELQRIALSPTWRMVNGYKPPTGAPPVEPELSPRARHAIDASVSTRSTWR